MHASPDPHATGLAGARKRWGPARHLAVGDLPAPDRAVLAAVTERARAERRAQGLPPTVTGPTLRAVAAILSQTENAAPVSETTGSRCGASDADRSD